MSACSSPPEAKKSKTDLVQIEAVLSDEYSAPVQLAPAIVCDVVDKKATSKLVRQLLSCYPLPQWSHLKRVTSHAKTDGTAQNHHSILVCPLERGLQDGDLLESVIPTKSKLFDGKDVDSDALGDPYVAMVPRCAPLTRRQFDFSRMHWSTAFHEDKYISRMMSDELFSQEELSIFQDHMQRALYLATESQTKGGLAIGCVIVDPASNSVIAETTDLRHHHPLQHAVMVCIDEVARQQGGGAWFHSDVKTPTTTKPTVKTGPYLLTGFDTFVSREPCVMCAMALLHSRVKRVFYRSSHCDGALGSRYKLHTMKSLNHHFEVFKGPISHDTKEVYVEESWPT